MRSGPDPREHDRARTWLLPVMQHQHYDPHPEDPVMAEECPGCHTTDQVRCTGNPPNTRAWACGMGWAVSVVNQHLRDRAGGYAEQTEALRWYLQQIITLAEEAPELTDEELRTRLHALAASCGAR
ncbi:MAG: hypothetical protein ACRDTH_19265 [Pseudonocardiaceae bacterium]